MIGNNTPINNPLWTPDEITTALWLDAADASTITIATGASEWRDKSGNNRHVSQATGSSQPTVSASALNNNDILAFNGSQYLTSSQAVWESPWEISVIAVIGFVDNSNRLSSLDIGSYHGSCFVIEQNTYYTSGQKYGFYAGSTSLDSACSTTSGEHIFSIIADGASSNIITSSTEYYIDGTIYGLTVNSGPGVYANPASGSFRIGAFNGYPLYHTGTIAEIIVVSSLVSNDDRQKLEGYLAWKWGLEAKLPSSHPYRNLAPTI